MILRPYQAAAVDRIRELIREGKKRVLLVAPCGAGKTVLFSHMISSAAKKGKRAIVIAHRRELLDQCISKLKAYGVEAGIISGGVRGDSYLPIQVCSIQTLVRRMHRLPPAHMIIVDEAHHVAADSYAKVLAAYPGVPMIGATATPWRTDKIGLAESFDAHVVAATPAELIENGALVRYEAFAWDAPELHDVRTVAGDYRQDDLELACNTQVLVGSAVKEYFNHCAGRSVIVFPVSIEHSRALVEEFRRGGASAEHVDCYMPGPLRRATLEKFDRGEITVLSSVGILSEGFDSPRAEVAILARPTKSLALHLQMIGRILRPFPGKTLARIHDHAGNLLRHGLVEDERDYTPGPTPPRKTSANCCEACGKVFTKADIHGRCPHCRAQVVPLCEYCFSKPCECREDERNGKILVDGRMIDIKKIRELRKAIGAKKHISNEELARAAMMTAEERKKMYEDFLSQARAVGYLKGWAAHRYREIFGVWPRFGKG